MFPALVSVSSPLLLVKTGLAYAFSIDVNALVANVIAVLTGGTIAGNLSVNGTIGYAVGSGGSVTQLTSKVTGVTLSKSCGQITMIATGDIGADTTVSFVLTNTQIAATDVLVLNHLSGGTPGSVHLNAQCAAGSATINVRNVTPANMVTPAPVISFALIKAVIT
jgi:hypothetical protein